MLGMVLQLELSALLLYERRADFPGLKVPALEQNRSVILRSAWFSRLNLATGWIAQLELNFTLSEFNGLIFGLESYSVCQSRGPRLQKGDKATM